MTEEEFDNGYWYAVEIKAFADQIGISQAFLAGEKNSTKLQAMKAWAQLKKLDIPKTYRAWKNYRQYIE
jgi:hypothetical protein